MDTTKEIVDLADDSMELDDFKPDKTSAKRKRSNDPDASRAKRQRTDSTSREDSNSRMVTKRDIKKWTNKAEKYKDLITAEFDKAESTLAPDKWRDGLKKATEAMEKYGDSGLNVGIIGPTNTGKTYIMSSLLRTLLKFPWRDMNLTPDAIDINKAKKLKPGQKNRPEDFPCPASSEATDDTAASLFPKVYEYAANVQLEVSLVTFEQYRINVDKMSVEEDYYDQLKDEFMTWLTTCMNVESLSLFDCPLDNSNIFDLFLEVREKLLKFERGLAEEAHKKYQPLISHFFFRAPFGLPDKWKFYEFPGFGDQNLNRKRNTHRLMDQLDCVILTMHSRSLEPKEFNELEPLMRSKTAYETMPQLVILDNKFRNQGTHTDESVTAALQDSSKALDQIKRWINQWKTDDVGDKTDVVSICSTIGGSKRVSLFDELQQRCAHYTFVAENILPGTKSDMIKDYKNHRKLQVILNNMLVYKIHRLLRYAFHCVRHVFYSMNSFLCRPSKAGVSSAEFKRHLRDVTKSMPPHVDMVEYEKISQVDEEVSDKLTRPFKDSYQKSVKKIIKDWVREPQLIQTILTINLEGQFYVQARLLFLKCYVYSLSFKAHQYSGDSVDYANLWNVAELQVEFDELYSHCLAEEQTVEEYTKENTETENEKIQKRMKHTKQHFEPFMKVLLDEQKNLASKIASLENDELTVISTAIYKRIETAFKKNPESVIIDVFFQEIKRFSTEPIRFKNFDPKAKDILQGKAFDETVVELENIFFADSKADEDNLKALKKQVSSYISTEMKAYDEKNMKKDLASLVTTRHPEVSKYMQSAPKMFEFNPINVAPEKQKLIDRSKALTAKLPTEKICDCHKNMAVLGPIDEKDVIAARWKALDYPKIISINHVGTAATESERFDGLMINWYDGWKKDLKECLSHNGSVIYIPTKGRAKTAKIAYNSEDLMEVTSEHKGLPYLVYAFVEENELESYITNFKDKDPDRLVFVSIPGTDRGIWFVRSLILILHRLQREKLAKEKISFKYWWMNDDDVIEVRTFDREAKIDCMHQCSLGMAMQYTATVMEYHLKQYDPRYAKDGDAGQLSDEASTILEDCLHRALPRDKWIALAKDKTLLSTRIQQLQKQLEFDVNDFNYEELGLPKKNATTELVQELHKEWHDMGKDVEQRIAQFALCPRRVTTMHNYNILDGKGSQYRVSNQRHAFILFNSVAVEGYSYYSWDELMWSQKKVDKEFKRAKESTDERNSFLGEDKVIVQRLAADGRSGLLLYCFDVKSPAPRSSHGGCRKFRTFNSQNIRNRPFEIQHKCEKNKKTGNQLDAESANGDELIAIIDSQE